MIRNYLKIVLRYLLREKVNTFINIAGLALGISSSLVLFLVVWHGTSYDTYHSRYNRIYRVVSEGHRNSQVSYTEGIPAPLPDALAGDFKEVENAVFTSYRRGSQIAVVQRDGTLKKFEESEGVVFTQPSFFDIFDRDMLTGSSKVLSSPNQAILSSRQALKYFGTDDAIGRIIRHENIEYQISGVMEDFPSTTDLPFDLMLSYATIQKTYNERSWGDISDNDNCYFLMKDGESVNSLEAQMPAFIKRHVGEEDAEDITFLVQPLHEVHSDIRFGNYNKRMPRIALIIFTVIALFLLAMACINFVNLATAEAIKRTRQAGIHKVLGSTRRQLIVQFLGESFLITIVAAILSLVVAHFLLGVVNPLMELSLTLGLLSDPAVWVFLGAVIIVVTIASGLYPAFAISGIRPALALKNQTGSRQGGNNLRKGLVVVQFFISQFFIIGTIVLARQLEYVQHKELGFEREAIVTVPIPASADAAALKSSTKHTLKNELMRLHGVEKVSLCFGPPSYKATIGANFSMAGSEDYDTQLKYADADYIPLFNIELIAGENLPDADTMNTVVVNEKLVKFMGMTNEEIVGKEFVLWEKRLTVKGVVKDFNTGSLERAIAPLAMVNNVNGYENISIKLNPVNMQETLKNVQARWEASYPEFIFTYNFLDEQIARQYRGERRMSTLLNVFSGIAIFIGCLGLYGLVAFIANQKTKEIGVRKVLGASVESIVLLFSRQFVKLILIGFALAAPAAGFIMHEFLQEFAYRIEIGPVIYLTCLGLTFFIAFATVGFRSVKAAMVNPVESLKRE